MYNRIKVEFLDVSHEKEWFEGVMTRTSDTVRTHLYKIIHNLCYFHLYFLPEKPEHMLIDPNLLRGQLLFLFFCTKINVISLWNSVATRMAKSHNKSLYYGFRDHDAILFL